MSQVSEVVLKYAARGAQRAQRADENVRQSIKRTGRAAREESGSVKQWMQRHKTALLAIGAATAGAMAMIIRASPDLSAQLASVRISFSLFAMTLGQDVAPATEGIGTKLIDLADAYAKLDPKIRKPISALVGLVGIIAVALPIIAGLQTLISGTVVASFLSWAASMISLSAITSAASTVFGVLAGVVATVAAVLGLPVWATAALIAIIIVAIAIITAYIFNIGGARDAINAWAADIWDFVKDSFNAYNKWRKGVLKKAKQTVDGVTRKLGNLKDRGVAKARELADGFVEWVGSLKDRGVAKAKDLVSGFVAWLITLRTRAGSKVDAVKSAVVSKLESLAGSATRWGKDLMSNFVSGIRAKIDAARNAVRDVSDAVKSYISFDIVSNDKMAERWGSDLMQHFAKGVDQNRSAIQRAMPDQSPRSFGLNTNPSPSSTGSTSRGGGSGPTEIVFEQGAIVLRGTGNSRRDGQNIADEASRGLADKFSRR